MNDFVPLKMQILALEELQKASAQDKFILLIGKSGLGKSFLLQKLCQDEKLILFSQPFFDENAFCEALCEVIGAKNLNFESLYAVFAEKKNKSYIFVCDEVGMYEENLLEKMRILSDLPHICFILSTHKKQKIFEKEYFASRIVKEIWLKNLTVEDLSLYVKEKFASLTLHQRHLKWLLKISDSNLRTVDKIITTFQKLFSFYTQEKQAKSTKNLLKMSAFYHKLL